MKSESKLLQESLYAITQKVDWVGMNADTWVIWVICFILAACITAVLAWFWCYVLRPLKKKG